MKKNDKKKEIQYYTEERWDNWISRVKESEFKINDEADGDTAVFVGMMDDVVLSCLKVVHGHNKKKISSDDALHAISSISEIVLREVAPINEDTDMMIKSLQSSLICALASCEYNIQGTYDKKTPLIKLIKSAIEIEGDNPEQALEYLSMVGARVLGGESMPDILFDVPDGLVAEWLDGVDSIDAAIAFSGND